MADETKKEEKALGSVLPMPFEIPAEAQPDYLNDPPDRIVPKKGSDGYDTPSGRALAKVGEFKGNTTPGEPWNDDPEAARAHGLKYLAEKMKLRWGIGVDS